MYEHWTDTTLKMFIISRFPDLFGLKNFTNIQYNEFNFISLGIPATSASSETAISVAEACITAKRSRLNPTNVCPRQLQIVTTN